MKYPKSPLLSMLIISFLGSLPPGIINLRVSTYLLSSHVAEAAAFSCGAALSEMFLVTVLIIVRDRLTPNRHHSKNIRIATAVLLLSITAFSILAAARPPGDQFSDPTIAFPWLSGFVMNLFNPFQLPFWTAWILVLNPPGTKQHARTVKVMMQGAAAALGTLFALILYGYASHLLLGVLPGSMQALRALCGLSFAAMVILQLRKLVTWQKSDNNRELT